MLKPVQYILQLRESKPPPSPVAFVVLAELGLLTELITVLLPLGGALEEEEEEDRPPSTESSSSKFLSATQEEKRGDLTRLQVI